MNDATFLQFLVALLGAVCGGMGAYYAAREKITVQLAVLEERIKHVASTAEKAHSRIDDLNAQKVTHE